MLTKSQGYLFGNKVQRAQKVVGLIMGTVVVEMQRANFLIGWMIWGICTKGGVYSSSAPSSASLATYYPANGGAATQWRSTILRPSQIIDRFGGSGRFFASAKTPVGARSLPYNTNRGLYTKYEVLKPFEVQTSIIAPAFGKIGGGIQYRSPVSAEVLLKRGIIKPIR